MNHRARGGGSWRAPSPENSGAPWDHEHRSRRRKEADLDPSERVNPPRYLSGYEAGSRRDRWRCLPATVVLLLLVSGGDILAQSASQFSSCQVLTNQEVSLRLTATKNVKYRLEVSTNLSQWDGWMTALSSGSIATTDSATPYLPSRFYRGFALADTNVLTGDHLATTDGDLVIHPVYHAAVVIQWAAHVIYVDPVGASRFTGLPAPDLILLTHAHTDHFDTPTLTAVKKTNTLIIASRIAYASLTTALKTGAIQMTNGAVTNVLDFMIEAVAAYTTNNANHPKGDGNGYILNLGGRRIYISGDTSGNPEMRALTAIDAAFLCMNTSTMYIPEAVSATRAFKPRIVYPYHYQANGVNSDISTYKRTVGTDLGIEVRFRAWY
jgi:L-ascorbate metabolism protein UlaG (beta-lactamase superfamily)